MKIGMVAAVSLSLCVACSAMEPLAGYFDRKTFEILGGTFLTEPQQVTIKEIHLDTSEIISGKKIVIVGHVVEIGKFETYVVVTDGTARVLVSLTDLSDVALGHYDIKKNLRFRILGSIESGKRGLPYIQATALKVLNELKEGDDSAPI